jgi:aminoglycoside phosphotransferase (APT) family kinase protein
VRRIHDDEPDTGDAVVRRLLASECPQRAGRPMEELRSSGTDNAMWRVPDGAGGGVVVRLPRRPEAAPKIATEAAVLRRLSSSRLTDVVEIPEVLHVGQPHEVFPHPWSVLGWLDGSDAWSVRAQLDDDLDRLAADLGRAVLAIREVAGDLPVPTRSPGERGGPIRPLVRRLQRWLDDPTWGASELVDVARVRRLAAEALEVGDADGTCFVHGDLIAGNLLVRSRRLSAILDWGGAGYGDPAQDLAPAWSVLDAAGRRRFRQVVGANDAAWVRARTIELEHAVGGVLYYVPRGHALGDVATATLGRILEEA